MHVTMTGILILGDICVHIQTFFTNFSIEYAIELLFIFYMHMYSHTHTHYSHIPRCTCFTVLTDSLCIVSLWPL